MLIEPYLFFEGRCEEALEFYRQKLGAEILMLMRYKESPDPVPAGMLPPGQEEKVMHASFKIGESTLHASDGACTGKPNIQGVNLSLSVTEPAEAERVFELLKAGGEVQMPFGKTFFSPGFGMVKDTFGVSWMVMATGSQNA